MSVAYLKDVQQARWDNDAAMKLYNADRGEVPPPASNPDDGQIYYGVAKAEAFVQALYRAGKNPTRAGLVTRSRA